MAPVYCHAPLSCALKHSYPRCAIRLMLDSLQWAKVFGTLPDLSSHFCFRQLPLDKETLGMSLLSAVQLDQSSIWPTDKAKGTFFGKFLLFTNIIRSSSNKEHMKHLKEVLEALELEPTPETRQVHLPNWRNQATGLRHHTWRKHHTRPRQGGEILNVLPSSTPGEIIPRSGTLHNLRLHPYSLYRVKLNFTMLTDKSC